MTNPNHREWLHEQAKEAARRIVADVEREVGSDIDWQELSDDEKRGVFKEVAYIIAEKLSVSIMVYLEQLIFEGEDDESPS